MSSGSIAPLSSTPIFFRPIPYFKGAWSQAIYIFSRPVVEWCYVNAGTVASCSFYFCVLIAVSVANSILFYTGDFSELLMSLAFVLIASLLYC